MKNLLRSLALLALLGSAACAPSPTPPPFLAPAIGTSEAATICMSPVSPSVQGDVVHAELVNNTGGQANLALGMLMPNSLDECGTYSYVIEAEQSLSVEVLAGCYWGYAWIDAAEASTAQSADPLCLTEPDQVFEISIETEAIQLD